MVAPWMVASWVRMKFCAVVEELLLAERLAGDA
jgi:hypothetical protein